MGEYTIPFGKANIVHAGDQLTIVATSDLVLKANEAAVELAKDGIFVEVVDLRTLVPLDRQTIIDSVKKTGKLLILDEGHIHYGIHGELGMSIMTIYSTIWTCQSCGWARARLPFRLVRRWNSRF